MSASRGGLKRWLMLAAKLLIVALVLWGVRRTLTAELDKLDRPVWHFDPLWLTAAGVLYLLGMCPQALFWHRLLRILDQRPTWPRSLRAWYIGHLGKYVPGKALVIVMRAGLLRDQGVDPVAATVAVFYETLTSMAVGALLAAGIVAVLFREHWNWVLISLGLLAVAGLPTWPPLASRLAKRLGVGRAKPDILEQLADLKGRTIASAWLSIGLGWIVMGLSLWAVLRAIGLPADAQLAELPRYTASVALSIVAGFVSFVPGGLVVREAVMMDLLAMGEPESVGASPLVAAVLMRVVGVVAELAISAILYAIPRSWRGGGTESAEGA